MEVYPVALKRLGNQRLWIQWSDGECRVYSYNELRDNCPCASCREKRRQHAPSPLPILTPEQTQPSEIERMEPVGNYAYRIEFNPGCRTGIYSFELLRVLGQVESTASGSAATADPC